MSTKILHRKPTIEQHMSLYLYSRKNYCINICTEIHENIKTVDKNYCINICTEIHENIKTVDKNYCINICTEIHENIKTVDKKDTRSDK